MHNLGRTRVAALAARFSTTASSHGNTAHTVAEYTSLAFALEVEGKQDTQAQAREKSIQCDLLREIIGNPFRQVTIDAVCRTINAACRTQTVMQLASLIYGDRRFESLPILADALEEAGCANSEILSHLRGPGPHLRGCWAVDAILGKM